MAPFSLGRRVGDEGNSSRNSATPGFLGAASARLETGAWGVAIDGVLGAVTESAVRNLQQYDDQVTGVVTSATWERLDIFENPYHSPLPWKF